MEMCTCRHTPRWHGLLGCAWCDCRSRTGPHNPATVPHCGECDERWIETPTGLTKCPRCYPKEMAS